MAKALLGYSVGSDPRVVHRLTSDNRSLRQRVTDLEDMIARLQNENDYLLGDLAILGFDRRTRDAGFVQLDDTGYVANDITVEGAGFNTDTNIATILIRGGSLVDRFANSAVAARVNSWQAGVASLSG